MRKQSIISSRLVAILAALAVALVAVAVILSKCEGTAVVEEKSDHVEVTPATIASIKSIGQWEFLTIHDEEYVDTVREGFFSDDGLARIYYGTLRLGLDMSHLDDHAIRMGRHRAGGHAPASRAARPPFYRRGPHAAFL